ncbi:hypothetical protein Hanom_Chr11g00981961 [Helianthus anomalus]
MPAMLFLSPGNDSKCHQQTWSILVVHKAAVVLSDSMIMVYKVAMAALRSICRSRNILPLDFHLMIVRSSVNP